MLKVSKRLTGTRAGSGLVVSGGACSLVPAPDGSHLDPVWLCLFGSAAACCSSYTPVCVPVCELARRRCRTGVACDVLPVEFPLERDLVRVKVVLE